MATIEITFNNKVHIATKSLLFKANYGRESRTGFEIRKIEACKDGEVCKRNEGNVWRSKSSIEKITDGNEINM